MCLLHARQLFLVFNIGMIGPRTELFVSESLTQLYFWLLAITEQHPFLCLCSAAYDDCCNCMKMICNPKRANGKVYRFLHALFFFTVCFYLCVAS